MRRDAATPACTADAAALGMETELPLLSATPTSLESALAPTGHPPNETRRKA